MLKKSRKINFVTIFALIILSIVLLMVVFPSLFTSYDPLEVNMEKKLLTPCGEHILGTDEYGRDIFCRIVFFYERICSRIKFMIIDSVYKSV